MPIPTSYQFTVLDVSGVHVVSLFFCGCYDAQSRYVQLLRVGWYPMTIDLPRAAATFTVLECFHELTLQGKLNIFDFYNALLCISDSSGVTDFKVCVIHQYQVIG